MAKAPLYSTSFCGRWLGVCFGFVSAGGCLLIEAVSASCATQSLIGGSELFRVLFFKLEEEENAALLLHLP
jgi:hypothetical protein